MVQAWHVLPAQAGINAGGHLELHSPCLCCGSQRIAPGCMHMHTCTCTRAHIQRHIHIRMHTCTCGMYAAPCGRPSINWQQHSRNDVLVHAHTGTLKGLAHVLHLPGLWLCCTPCTAARLGRTAHLPKACRWCRVQMPGSACTHACRVDSLAYLNKHIHTNPSARYGHCMQRWCDRDRRPVAVVIHPGWSTDALNFRSRQATLGLCAMRLQRGTGCPCRCMSTHRAA